MVPKDIILGDAEFRVSRKSSLNFKLFQNKISKNVGYQGWHDGQGWMMDK